MDHGKKCLVKLLQEEASSLRSEGKRVAAEAVERTLVKFDRTEQLLGQFRESPSGRWASPLEAAQGFFISPCAESLVTILPPGGAIPDNPGPPAAMASVISCRLGEVRDKLLNCKSGSFRMIAFRMSSRHVDRNKDGTLSISQEGSGEVDILRNTDEGRRTAVADFLAALPAPPQGFKREMLSMETSPFDAKPVLKFKFRDVEVTREV